MTVNIYNHTFIRNCAVLYIVKASGFQTRNAQNLYESVSFHTYIPSLMCSGKFLLFPKQASKEPNPGNTMQFCLHLGQRNADLVYKIYEVLKEGALTHDTVGDSDYSKHCFSFVDKIRRILVCI